MRTFWVIVVWLGEVADIDQVLANQPGDIGGERSFAQRGVVLVPRSLLWRVEG